MKNLLAIFFLLALPLGPNRCDAQSRDDRISRLDSLKLELAGSKDDKHKVDLYINILVLHVQLQTRTEEGLEIIQPALELSEKLDYKLAETNLWAGRVYWRLGKTVMALKFHFEALALYEEEKDEKGTAEALTAIGQDYTDDGNYEKGLEYFTRLKDIHIKSNNINSLAGTYNLISFIHSARRNYTESYKNNLEALKVYEELKDDYGIAITSANLADDLVKLDKYEEAITYYLKSCEYLVKTDKDPANLSITYTDLSNAYLRVKDYPQALRYAELSYLAAEKTDNKILLGKAKRQIANGYMLQQDFAGAIPPLRSAVAILRPVNAYPFLVDNYNQLGICYVRTRQPLAAKNALDSAAYFSQKVDSRQFIKDYLYGRQLYDSTQGNWKNAYLRYHQYIGLRDSIVQADNTMKLMQTHLQHEFDKKEAATQAENERKAARARVIRNAIAGGLAGTLVFLVIVWRQRNKINAARRRSDELLLNILPEEVAEELKAEGQAEAVHFDMVTVLFTDFKGFTAMSERMTPRELVHDLHECFSAFDKITEKWGIEKIKTIGDAYMAAGGLPTPNTTHAADVVKAALEMTQFVEAGKAKKIAAGRPFFEIRVGVHSGPVVAGIVGVKKFQYDIWGDTVNTAARMESAGEPGRVNVSQATYALLKGDPGFVFESRGEIEAKGKGAMAMYFVEAGVRA